MNSPIRRLPFEAIELVSRMMPVGPFGDRASLARDLAMLARAYGVEAIGPETFDDRRAVPGGYFARPSDYYTGTEAQYSGVHSPEGSVHFALNWNGEFHPTGFLEHARLVEEIVRRTRARAVLEIGSGKGLNSVFLARRNPDVSFMGIDLTPIHVRLASERAAGLPNMRFVEGDYHRLAECDDASLDLVFDVEAGCYSDTPEKLAAWFAELQRVLRRGGTFVTFGWCRTDRFDELDRPTRLTAELVERAWVLRQFPLEREWNSAAARAGLVARERRDLRQASMPSVVRLYRQARLFYTSLASPARPVVRRLMRPSTHNAVSPFMLPHAYTLDALEYRMAVRFAE